MLIEGVTFTNSPMWILNPVLCENVTIRGVTVDSHGPNNDGCDPESCRNVLIENCTFDTGDDCIAIKSGRNADGRRIGVPSENIIIRGCTMKDGHGGVVLGSEMSGGIRNVFVEDCEMDSPNLDRAIRLKSNTMRGGYLENLFVRNVKVGQVADAVVRINLNYDKDRGEQNPTVRNIFIEGVTSEREQVRRSTSPASTTRRFKNVVLENCTFKNAAKAERDRERRRDHAPQLPAAAQGRHRPQLAVTLRARAGGRSRSVRASQDFVDPLRRDDPQIVARLAAVVAGVDRVAVLARRSVGVEGVADLVLLEQPGVGETRELPPLAAV